MLDNFLRKIKLIQEISIEIPLSSDNFKRKLTECVSENKFNLFEGLNNGEKIFVGELGDNKFKIRPIKQIFQNSLARFAWCKCTYEESSQNKIIIKGEVSLATFHPLIFLLVFPFVYGLIITIALITWTDYTPIIFVFLHFLLMLAIFYFICRRFVSSGKYYMERELYFLSK